MQYLATLLCFLCISSFAQDGNMLCNETQERDSIDTTVVSTTTRVDEVKSRHLPDISNSVNQSNFEGSVYYLYNAIGLNKQDLSYEIFRYGMIGYYTLQQQGKLSAKSLLSIIDFTKPSSVKRLYVIDLAQLSLLYYTYVSHGKNTGEDRAEKFSNIIHSNQSSIGFYLTAETYIGSKGYSLKLDGMEKGYNDNLRDRAVVMHEADYVSEDCIRQNGRLGRSQGCPALPVDISKNVIDTIKDYTPIFAYYNDITYLKRSEYLSVNHLLNMLNTSATLPDVLTTTQRR